MFTSDPSRLITRTEYPVTSADTDMEARLRPGGLLSFLILAAVDSADKLGFGLNVLRRQNLLWVLSRITVEIVRPLKWYETAVVETWPRNIDRLLYIRDYRVYDGREELVARATSAWATIDFDTHRPHLLREIDMTPFTLLKDRHGITAPPVKIEPVAEGDERTLQTTYFDIDLNRHVTSSRYVDWMIDHFPAAFHANHYPSSISVNYLKETPVDESVRILRTESSSGKFRFTGRSAAGARPLFCGEIDF